jgi:hypothetical protein
MKKKFIILILLAASLLIFGCSRKSDMAYRGYSQSPMRFNDTAPQAVSTTSRERAESVEIMENFAANDLSNINYERKLVKCAYARIRVENLEAADTYITNLMNEYNAYSASTYIEEYSRVYTLRVPAQYYDAFLSNINGMGRLLSRNETTEDVTLNFYDLEGRLATKKELLRTFQAYLGRANSIDEILSVEARIAELQYDIEGTGIQLRNLANRIDYATIELYILGPAGITPIQNITFGEQLKQLFSNFGKFLSTVGVFITGFIIYGIPVLLILGLLYWLLLGRIGLLKKAWQVIRK